MAIAAENIQVMLLQRNSEEITPDYGNCCRKYLNNAAPEKYSEEIAPDYGNCCSKKYPSNAAPEK